MRVIGSCGGGGKSCGELGVVESRLASALGGVHENKFGFAAFAGSDAIGEAVAGKPCGAKRAAENKGRGVIAHELFGARVVLSGECAGSQWGGLLRVSANGEKQAHGHEGRCEWCELQKRTAVRAR